MDQMDAAGEYADATRKLDGARNQLGAAVVLFLKGEISRDELARYSEREQQAEKKRDEAERKYRGKSPTQSAA